MSRRLLLIALICFCCHPVPHTRAQPAPDEFVLTAEKLHSQWDGDLSAAGWRYHAGDDPRWAAADYDDSGWEKLTTTRFAPTALPRAGWAGAAWFRLPLTADEEVARETVALRLWHWGASEIYVDGRLIGGFGRVSGGEDGEEEFQPDGRPVVFSFGRGGSHVVAVRYSFQSTRDLSGGVGAWLARAKYFPNFRAHIQTANYAVRDHAEQTRGTRWSGVFIGVLVALALLHALLFVFYRRERANLFYSLFAFGLAAGLLSGYFFGDGRTARGAALLFIGYVTAYAVAMPSFLAFLYVAFAGKISKPFWAPLALWGAAVVLVLTLVRDRLTLYAVSLAFALTLVDATRLVVRALARRKRGARIIAGGLLLFTCGIVVLILGALLQFERGLPAWVEFARSACVFLAVPFAVSIHLARDFARTNSELEAQLERVQILSANQIEQERVTAELALKHEKEKAESERRARELEEARQLQLSMLPKSVPRLPNLDIAAYMKPASEVGGDYYDFHVDGQGTLTVAVGDATGHGLKAGTVVTATKGLFNALAGEEHIPTFFRSSSRALKEMNMRGLYMAMVMMKITGDEAGGSAVTFSAAGMPPVLVYRAGQHLVEELQVNGMPLGSVPSFPYRQRALRLLPGDVLLLMSDGFPERFNERGEMIDSRRAHELLIEVAGESPQTIIERFVGEGDRWAGRRPQDDDVTFVVLKAKRAP